MTNWGNNVEIEIKRRINVSIWAYAYEIENESLVSDEVFDNECMLINDSICTNNVELDKFFKNIFDPFTGVWIHKHPHLNRIKHIYEQYIKL